MTLWVQCAIPNPDLGRKIAQAMLEQGLAEQVRIVPGLIALYRQQGNTSERSEALLVAKVGADQYKTLETLIQNMHPYKNPEIIAIPLLQDLP